MRRICVAIFIANLCLQISCERINTPRCGRALPLSRIVNGQTVSRTRMPWILEKPLNFDKFVSPVCLPKKPISTTGRPLLIAGWGFTKEGGPDSDTLRYILKKELPYKQCKPLLHHEAQLTLNETIVICATARSKDACTGDSGAPVTTWNKRGKFFQVGIVSFGYGCARPNDASGYTRVATFVPWILSVKKRYERDGHSK
ncbi:serine proteinase stubble-like isoform X2 [Dermacentor albipictus]|uniref:serine proteinase stubble-like isoform X2 n=1 Tax=Dermacentor albipictus TaxID=60249 RepID=UPI0031FDB8B0